MSHRGQSLSIRRINSTRTDAGGIHALGERIRAKVYARRGAVISMPIAPRDVMASAGEERVVTSRRGVPRGEGEADECASAAMNGKEGERDAYTRASDLKNRREEEREEEKGGGGGGERGDKRERPRKREKERETKRKRKRRETSPSRGGEGAEGKVRQRSGVDPAYVHERTCAKNSRVVSPLRLFSFPPREYARSRRAAGLRRGDQRKFYRIYNDIPSRFIETIET